MDKESMKAIEKVVGTAAAGVIASRVTSEILDETKYERKKFYKATGKTIKETEKIIRGTRKQALKKVKKITKKLSI